MDNQQCVSCGHTWDIYTQWMEACPACSSQDIMAIEDADVCNDNTWLLDDVDRDRVSIGTIGGWPIYRAKDD